MPNDNIYILQDNPHTYSIHKRRFSDIYIYNYKAGVYALTRELRTPSLSLATSFGFSPFSL